MEQLKRMRSAWILAMGMAVISYGVPASAQEAPKLTDAEIAAIVVAANQIDIDNGKLAQEKAKSDLVQEFGKRMVTDHSAVNKQAQDLAGKLDLTPKESKASKDLQASAEKTASQLKKLKGEKFDRAYLDAEIKFHQAVIDTVDKALLPNAQNAELKALLEEVRPALVSHLEHAKQLKSSMMAS